MIDKYCSGLFWDVNKTWYSDIPDFTPCFEDIVLVSVPCFSFAAFFIIALIGVPRRASHHILPWTYLNASKMILSLFLIFINVVICASFIHNKIYDENVPYSMLVAAVSRVLVFVLVLIIMLMHKRSGVTTSHLLSFFWVVLSLFETVQYRTFLLNYFVVKSEPVIRFIPILNMGYYPLILLQLILSIYPDKKNFSNVLNKKIMDEVSFLPKYTFTWFTRIIYMSRKKMLDLSDFAFGSVKLTASCTFALFSRHWKFHLIPTSLSHNLSWALAKAFWPWIVYGTFCEIGSIILSVLPSLILDRIIYCTTYDHFAWKGYFFIALLFITNILSQCLMNQFLNLCLNTGSQIISTLMGVIYRKNFSLSTTSRKEYSCGDLITLFSVDAKRFEFGIYKIVALVTCPLKVCLNLFILWQYLGISTLASIAVILVMLPFNFYVSKYGQRFVDEQMKIKDTRLKYMNEILSGIKIIKLFAWELVFGAKIATERKKEIQQIRYNFICFIIVNLVYFCSPVMIALATYSTYLLLNPDNVLDPTKAFVSITLISQLRSDLFFFPDAISSIIQLSVSLDRMKKLFLAENKEENVVGSSPAEGAVISFKKASFSWTTNLPAVLHDIDFNIQQGKLLAIIGPVGAGKSSLISALLGEMHKVSGNVDILGSIAYVAQEAWILNRTVKENILLTKHLSDFEYNRILDVCCLRPDLNILINGDDTEIGEKGVNLSGGQKQRVNLARALCQDREIYLLDDPLSAVDVHVRKALFKDVISNHGLLKNKTRILVTHEVSILQDTDLILSIKDGVLDEFGTYDELMGKNGSFSAFVEEHMNVSKDSERCNGETILKLSPEISENKSLSVIEVNCMGNIQEDDDPSKSDDKFKLIQDEKMEQGEVSYSVYWKYVKKIGPVFIFFTILGYILNITLESYSNIWLSQWSLDGNNNSTQNNVKWRLTIYGVLGLCDVVAVFIGSGALIIGTTIASVKFHDQMLNSVLRSPISFFDCTPQGRIVNRFSTDMDVMDTVLFYKYDVWLTCFMSAMGCFIVISIYVPYFILGLLPVGIVYYTFQRLHLHCLRQIRRLESVTRSPIYSHFLESIQGASSICAFNLEEEFINSFEEKLDKNLVCSFLAQICNRWLGFILDMLGSVLMVSASLLAFYNRQSLNPALVGLIVSYAIQITSYLKYLVRMSTDLEDKSISVERINEYCNLEPEAPWKMNKDDELIDWPHSGIVTLDNYSTKYREELDLVLKEINLSVNSSEKIGIVGRTGAGKSSMALALFRIIEPCQGKIFIDDVDINEIGLHKLRSSLTIIPQDPILFIGSLRSNLDPCNIYSDHMIWTSLEQAHLKKFVLELTEGLDYQLEEGGSNLSVGQRQLVCLARALIKKTKVLIMDEATASVDMETDCLIQNTIRTTFADCTVITVAHRLHTIIDYDKVIVLQDGTIVEVGNPNDLKQNPNSYFHAMCKEAKLI